MKLCSIYARLLIKFDIRAVSKTRLGEFRFRQNRRSEDHALIMGVEKLLLCFRHSLTDVGEMLNNKLHIKLFTNCVS